MFKLKKQSSLFALSLAALLAPPSAWADLTVSKAQSAWLIDIDPARPFRQEQGFIPSGVAGKAGRPNRVIASVETVADESPQSFNLSTLIPQLTSGDTLKWGASRAPDYLYSSPVFTVGYETLKRVADPANNRKWAYLHRINRWNFGSYRMTSTTPVPDSIRSEVAASGEDRFEPWGTEEMAVFAIRLPANWRSIEPNSEWSVHFQWHDAEGGLTHNPPFSLLWSGGGANPSNSHWKARVRRYAYTPSEYASNPERVGNRIAKENLISNPAADRWHYFVAHYRSGPGPYRDPKDGLIYGPTDPSKVFFRLYHATGGGALQPVLNYTGFWGSPHHPDSSNKWKAGYWKTGIYMKSNWSSGGPDRFAYTKGSMVWRLKDIPGLTPQKALQAFKLER